MLKEFAERLKSDDDNKLKKKVYKWLSRFIIILGLFIAFGLLFPTAASILANMVWVTLFAIVVTFLTLGVLVIFGLRKEVAEVLDVILEGGLSLLDAIELLKQLWEKFKEMVREFLIYIAPVFAYIGALFVYLLVLIFYKTVGKTYDVTYITIILTFTMISAVSILNRPNKKESRIRWEWVKTFMKRFHRGFTDGLEVVLFIFFLTMDNTDLFFLPKTLNTELHAQLGNYNLMRRGFDLADNTKVTISLIIATIIIEIVRNIIRIFAMSRMHFIALAKKEKELNLKRSAHERLKEAIRMTFSEFKDELIKFITFNTILLLVFLIFPRLKLLTLVVASITGLILDFLIRGRLIIKSGDDLISRVLNRLLKLDETDAQPTSQYLQSSQAHK